MDLQLHGTVIQHSLHLELNIVFIIYCFLLRLASII